MRRPGLVLFLSVFLVALGVRAWHVSEVEASPFADVLLGDGRAYDAWGRELAAGDWRGDEVFYQAPLYPYFLGVLYTWVGDSPATVRGVQAVLGALACALLALATRRLAGEGPGWAAGGILALYAPAIFFDGILQKSTLDVLLLAALVLAWVAWAQRPRAWLGGVLGGVLGVLALARENALLLVPVVAGALLLPRSVDAGRRLRSAALLAAGLAVALAPVAWRNHAISGEWHLTTSQLGPNLYYGNHEGANGTYRPLVAGRGDARYERHDARDLAERAEGRELTPAEVSRYWRQRALAFVREQPLDWLALEARKLVLALGAAEVTDTEDQGAYADWSRPLRWLAPIDFGVLLPLAVVGLLGTRPRGRGEAVARRGLIAMAAVYLAGLLVFYVFARYRYPLVPLLLPLAAAGLCALPRLVRERRGGPLGAALVVAVLGNWSFLDLEPQRAMTYSNLADALMDQERAEEALPWLDRALEIQPTFAEAHSNRAAALILVGEPDAAAEAARAALEVDPENLGALQNLGLAFERLGRPTDAELEYLRALELDPDFTEAHFALGRLAMARDDLDEAERRFRRAIELRPGSANAHSNLGMVLALRDDVVGAAGAYAAALEVDPDHANTHFNLGALLTSIGKQAEGRAHLERVLELEGEKADVHYLIGVTFGRERRAEEAVRHFRRALELDPSHAGARESLRLLGADS